MIDCSVKVGVIGVGGRLQGILQLLNKVARGIEITAIFDPDQISRDEALAGTCAGARVCNSPEELCESPDVDWVFIGSPNVFHAEQAVLAFQHGKHVFCEKPLALSVEQAADIHAAWKASGKTLALGLVLRYSPLYRAAKEAIDQGQIGEILSFEFNETLSFNHGGYIHGNWRRNTSIAGSHLLEKCCHDIDLALWLTGLKPLRVASFGGLSFFHPKNERHQERIGPGPKGELAFQSWRDPHGINPFNADKDIIDHQVAALQLERGVTATFHTHCMAGIQERRFYIIGSEGALRLDASTGTLETRRVGWDEKSVITNPAEGSDHAGADEPMCRELAECMAGHRDPAASFAEGLNSLVVAQAVDAAMSSGTVVDLKPYWEQVQALR